MFLQNLTRHGSWSKDIKIASVLIIIDPVAQNSLFSWKNGSCLLFLILCSLWYLDQGSPIALSVMKEILYICTIQHGSHQPYVVTENLKCSEYYWKLDFRFYLILTDLNLSNRNHMWVADTVLNSSKGITYCHNWTSIGI